MSTGLARAGAVDALTVEQRIAAATSTTSVFIEAGPGTGKTTVSAHRYGVQRFAPEHRHDPRAIVAVSFTRAATKNLRRRVQRLWGPSALAPNTVSARPPVRARNERRLSPVPAGTGIPRSMDGSPLPAEANVARSSSAREKSSQWLTSQDPQQVR